VATISWAQRLGWEAPGGPLLALRVGGEHRFALLDDRALAAHVEKSGQSWASEELMAGIIRAKDAWRYVEHDAPQTMRAALDTHWNRVPVLRHVGL
jgi:hypothetical protein